LSGITLANHVAEVDIGIVARLEGCTVDNSVTTFALISSLDCKVLISFASNRAGCVSCAIDRRGRRRSSQGLAIDIIRPAACIGIVTDSLRDCHTPWTVCYVAAWCVTCRIVVDRDELATHVTTTGVVLVAGTWIVTESILHLQGHWGRCITAIALSLILGPRKNIATRQCQGLTHTICVVLTSV
jgi:hypothetical protein